VKAAFPFATFKIQQYFPTAIEIAKPLTMLWIGKM
jgi:hypothetical protein